MCLGVPARIVEIKGDVGVVDVKGNQVEISLRLTPEAKVNDYVLVHAGFAMEIIDQEAALQTLDLLEEMEQRAVDGGVF